MLITLAKFLTAEIGVPIDYDFIELPIEISKVSQSINFYISTQDEKLTPIFTYLPQVTSILNLFE